MASKPMSKEQEEFEPSDKLVEQVEQGLVGLGKDDEDEDSTPAESEASQAESEAESESQLEIESEADDDEDSTPAESEASQAESEAESEENSLPDKYYRAAIHQGWKPEDVADFFKSNPKVALKTFENIYKSTNKLSQQFAAAGRTLQKGSRSSNADVQPKKKSYVDVKALREKYGDDEPLVDVIDTLQQGLQEALGLQESNDAFEPESNENGPSTDDIALAQVLFNFFGADDMKPFADFYGKGESITQMQDMNRYAVTQMADNIIAGAELHGQDIDTVDALNMAHLAITEPLRKTIYRRDILKTAKKRQKGINFRPSKNKPAPKKAQTEKEKEKGLIKKTEGRLKKLFS